MGHVKIGLVLWHDKLKMSNKETMRSSSAIAAMQVRVMGFKASWWEWV